MTNSFPSDAIRAAFPDSLLVERTGAGPADVDDLRRAHGGSDIGPGLYRIHTPASAAQATNLVRAAFPHAPSFSVFGMDWLGRQFATLEVDDGRAASEAEVAMFELASGEAVALPVSARDFHRRALVEDPDGYVARAAFDDWLRTGHPTPRPEECVGYVIPLFLGGSEDFSNFKIADWQVYWGVIGQALARVDGLPEGAAISGVDIGF